MRELQTSEILTYMKKTVGRPTVMTPVVIGKLETVFSLDGTVKEACFYAGINPDTYFEFMKKNPEYTERFEALRQRPVLKARETVVKEITKNYNNAMDYLSRKAKKEFSQRTELTEAEGTPLTTTLSDEEKKNLLALLPTKL